VKIVCISDTHNRHNEIDVGSGDILLHAGDATGRGYLKEIRKFMEWYAAQDFAYKIFIAGNHDWGWEGTKMGQEVRQKLEKEARELGLIYLNDSGTTIKCFDTGKDIKIWGSPVQPEFCNWAFNRTVHGPPKDLYHHSHGVHPPIKPHWDMIPDDTDILITHGPPEGIRDEVPRWHGIIGETEHVGCPHLMDAIENRIKPKMHVFGHIHEEYGVSYKSGTMFVNASSLDDRYVYSHKPVEILWEDEPKHK
jgi:predicted phosphodiesterase